jgi:hypothetical protein
VSAEDLADIPERHALVADGGQLCEGSSLASRGSILLSIIAMLGELELSTPIHASASRVPLGNADDLSAVS